MVHLPAEFRFEDSDAVYIRRDTVTGDVILSPKPASRGWADFFALRDQAQSAGDFATDRPMNDALQSQTAREEA